MAERSLTDVEQKVVHTYLQQFIPQWQAHGSALKAGYELIENQFIIIVVDETPASASGCSIDSLTRYIKLIESKLELSFTNRMLVTYQKDGSYYTLPLAQFKRKVKAKDLGEDVIIYDNSVSTLSEFWDKWKQPLNKSWASVLLQ